MENKILTIPLFSWYYIGITLVLILMQYLNIIDWSPIWLLSPLWVPCAISILIIIVLYLLRLIIFLIGLIIFKKFRI